MLEDLFPYILPIHIGTSLLLIGTVLYADSLAFSWMRGKRETLESTLTRRLHLIVWSGLLLMALTGALLFYPYRDYLLSHPPFLAKLGFVAALFVNGTLVGRLSKIATAKAFPAISPGERNALFLSGAVSLISWVGALIFATMIDLS